MAKTYTTKFNVENNFDQTAKDADNLSKATDKAADSGQRLDATFEDIYGEIQPLTTRMGEAEDRLYELAIAGDTATQEYQDLLAKVGEYRKVQIQTDLAVDQASQTFSQKLGTALTGATSGFAAVQGTMALVGSESQALEKTLLKVQAAMAIQQGVAGVLEYSRSVGLATKATKAWSIITGTTTGMFKALRVALIATGIGAIVVGIGLLIANFDKLKSVMTPVVDGFKALGDAIGISNFEEEERLEMEVEALEIMNKQIEASLQQLKLESRYREDRMKNLELDLQMAATEEERLSIRQKMIAETLKGFDDERKAVLDDAQIRINNSKALEKRLAAQYNEERNSIFRSQEKLDLYYRYYEDQIAATADLQKQLDEKNFQSLVEIDTKQRAFLQKSQQEEVKSEEETNDKKLNNYKKYLQDRLNAARRIEDLENELMDEGLEKELEINRDRFRRQREDIKAQGKQKQKIIDLLNELELKKEKEIREKFDVFKLESFDGEIAQLELQSVKEIEIKKLTNEEIEKQMSESAARQKAIDDKLSADKRANAIAVADANLTIAHDSLGAIGELANAFAKDDEKNAKKAFNINKAVGIAQAVVSTAQGIMAQLAVPQDALTGANFIKAGIVAATGAAQIATISASKFQGGGGETPSLDASGGEAQAPSFNVVGDSGINQLASLKSEPIKAFVVSGEVTTSQALDRNRVENATL